jgi:hypothetical protein
MTTIRVQGPEGFGGFSHAGQSYTADEDGVIEVPAHIPNEVLAAHSLKRAAAKPAKVLAKEDAPKAMKGGKPEKAAGDEGAEDNKAQEPETVKPAKEDAPKAMKGGSK